MNHRRVGLVAVMAVLTLLLAIRRPGLWHTSASTGEGIIAAGRFHTCAMVSGSGPKCWGNNTVGQLGNGTTITSSLPVEVSGLGSGITAFAAGSVHTCALTSGGGVKCWGYNYHGQLGDGTTTDKSTPVAVSGLGSGIMAIAAGWNHTCGLTCGVKL